MEPADLRAMVLRAIVDLGKATSIADLKRVWAALPKGVQKAGVGQDGLGWKDGERGMGVRAAFENRLDDLTAAQIDQLIRPGAHLADLENEALLRLRIWIDADLERRGLR